MKKKKLLFGATVVATTIATGVTAQADSVNDNATANVAQVSVQSPTKTAENKVAAADKAVTDAQTSVDTAQQTVKQTKSDLDSAKSDLDSAKDLKDQATPEAIDQAKSDADSTKEVQDQAQTTVDQTQQDVEHQSAVVDSAKQDLDSKTSDLQTAQKDELDAQHAVDQAQHDVDSQKEAEQKLPQLTEDANKAKDEVDSAQTSIDQAQTNFDTAQKNLADANTNKTTADSQVEAKKSEVSTAKDAVDTAQKALDTKGSKAELDQAQTDFDSAKSTKANAQKDLAEKQTAKENADKAVAPAKEALATAKDTQNLLQEAVDQAKSEQQAQVNVVTDLQNKLDQATQTTNKTNVQIHVTNELKQAVQKYVNDVYANADKTTLNNDAKAIQDIWSRPANAGFKSTGMSAASGTQAKIQEYDTKNAFSITFTPSQKDYETMPQQKHQVDAIMEITNNLTNEQINELNQTLADTINAIRDTFGISDKVGHVIANKDAINIANQVSNFGSAKNPQTNNIASQYGLNHNSFIRELLLDESSHMLNDANYTIPWNLAYFKTFLLHQFESEVNSNYKYPLGDIVDRKGDILYDHDANGTITKSILGISPMLIQQAKNNTNKDQFFGYSSPEFPNRAYTTNNSERFIFIPQSMITDKSKFDQTPLFQNTTTDTSALRPELDQATSRLQSLTNTLTQAQAKLDTANAQVKTAQTAYDQAVLAHDKAQADLTTAQAKLDSAKQAQQQAQAELAKVKQEQMTLMNFEKAYQAAQNENPARKLNVHTVGNEKQQPAKENNVLPQMGDKNSLAGVVLGMMTTLAALGTAIVSRRKRS